MNELLSEVSKGTFTSEVLEAEVPVVVDFWGPQCGPRLKPAPVAEQLAARLEGRLKVVKVEAPKNRRLCMQLRVLSLPTFLAYADGREVERLSGEVTPGQLEQLARRLTGAAAPAEGHS